MTPRQEQIAKLWREGLTQGRIADKLSISVGSVSATVAHLRSCGVDLALRRGGRRPRPDLASRARLLVLLGVSQKEVGRRLGVPRATVSEWAGGATASRSEARELMRGAL